MTLFVGTSGWAYPEWKPEFYPKDVPQRRFLEHYSSQLSACEINATFYKEHEREVVERWAQEVPPHFRFAIKTHRALTHGKAIDLDGPRGERLRTFLHSIQPLAERLGPLLIQLPAYRKLDLDGLRTVVDALPSGQRFAFEFRDDSWNDPAVIDTITARGGTVCLSDKGGEVPLELPRGDFAYVRLRAERYPRNKRAAWRKLLERESGARDVYAFTKHEGVPAGDPFGGVGLAQWLERYARRQPARLSRRSENDSSNHTVVA